MSFFSFLLEKKQIEIPVYQLILNKTNYEDQYNILAEHIQEDEISRLLAEYANLPIADTDLFKKLDIDYERFKNLPAFPLYAIDTQLYVATYNPDDIEVRDCIEYYVQSIGFKTIKYCIASRTQICQYASNIANNDAPTNNYLLILNDAIKANASDIHITPYAKFFIIMLRIDGELQDYNTLPIENYSNLAISLKVKAKLDISENRRPQSGQFCYGTVDFRLSTHPTMYGENIVIRILNKDKQLINIEALGFNSNDVEYLKGITVHKQGMIIFCGPTGSGKSTSIYALIELMDKKGRNIMTLEDPIEYNIANVRQTEIIPGVIDFVSGIRSILRQDPDVILIGEIRDEETAQMAIRASMTGHLVLTTIHANDSLGAIFRLRHFNIPSSFIAENLTAIISQRLVRNQNRSGRTVIAEILKPDTQFRELISREVSRHEMLMYASEKLGYKPLNCNSDYSTVLQ